MRKITILLIGLFLVIASSSFQNVVAQEKTKADQEKEEKLQREIDQLKKEMTEQKKVHEAANQALIERQILLNKSQKDILIDIGDTGQTINKFRIYSRRGIRLPSGNDPFIFAGQDIDPFYGRSYGGDSEKTTWDFSRSVTENTFSRDYTFNVEKNVHTVIMSVMGDCKSGEIHIKIFTPGGNTFSDIVIDESGNLNWRKTFNISEKENQDKTGDWKFQITSNKATGFFKISLQSY